MPKHGKKRSCQSCNNQGWYIACFIETCSRCHGDGYEPGPDPAILPISCSNCGGKCQVEIKKRVICGACGGNGYLED